MLMLKTSDAIQHFHSVSQTIRKANLSTPVMSFVFKCNN
uniref:Uncharacterized protein n=1 Tax=Anguilla anguilla TaxID=7936 RepID=A0A0E9SVW2_ANGAN